MWITENESASFWASVCNELRNRGVEDILITCRDNLSGFSQAIKDVFTKTEQQLCIIHQIRNSTRYVSYKDFKAIYQALSEDDALYHLEEFKDNWNKKYPQISKSLEDNWAALSAYFKYPAEVRRLIYTTNAVDSFHRMLRKYTKTKTVFPSDDSLRKSIYLSIQEITKKWCMPVQNCKRITVGCIYFKTAMQVSGRVSLQGSRCSTSPDLIFGKVSSRYFI